MTIGYVSHDLGWSHNKNYLMVDNVILKSQTVQMERLTLPTGPMDFLMGPNSLC